MNIIRIKQLIQEINIKTLTYVTIFIFSIFTIDCSKDKPITHVTEKGLKATLNWLKELGKEYGAFQDFTVKKLKDLESIDLSDGNINDEDLIHLKPLVNLRILFLARTKITDKGLLNLKYLKKLKILSLHNTKISDTGLKYLKDLDLVSLDVSSTIISDNSILYLKNHLNLDFIDISKTKVTKKGFKELSELFPHCEIKF